MGSTRLTPYKNYRRQQCQKDNNPDETPKLSRPNKWKSRVLVFSFLKVSRFFIAETPFVL